MEEREAGIELKYKPVQLKCAMQSALANSSRHLSGHLREAFPALVTKTVSADTRIAATGSSFARETSEIKSTQRTRSWAVKDVRAHHHTPTGDSRDVIGTYTGGPPKHYTQPDFEAAREPHSARGPLSRVLIVTMT